MFRWLLILLFGANASFGIQPGCATQLSQGQLQSAGVGGFGVPRRSYVPVHLPLLFDYEPTILFPEGTVEKLDRVLRRRFGVTYPKPRILALIRRIQLTDLVSKGMKSVPCPPYLHSLAEVFQRCQLSEYREAQWTFLEIAISPVWRHWPRRHPTSLYPHVDEELAWHLWEFHGALPASDPGLRNHPQFSSLWHVPPPQVEEAGTGRMFPNPELNYPNPSQILLYPLNYRPFKDYEFFHETEFDSPAAWLGGFGWRALVDPETALPYDSLSPSFSERPDLRDYFQVGVPRPLDPKGFQSTKPLPAAAGIEIYRDAFRPSVIHMTILALSQNVGMGPDEFFEEMKLAYGGTWPLGVPAWKLLRDYLFQIDPLASIYTVRQLNDFLSAYSG